jgi:AraC family transcriptional regulator, activator of mtrCDE
LAAARTNASTVHYCLRGAGVILLDGETLVRLTLHTSVIVPPGRAMTIAATEHPTAPRSAGKHVLTRLPLRVEPAIVVAP